jgi:phytanoyl-CoA hydroxylase
MCAPSAELAHAFGEHGFVRLDPFAAPDEMAVLAEYVDRAIERGSGHRGDNRRGALVWLPKPEQHAPELASCFALRRARRLAAALLDVDEEKVAASPRIFSKPPRAGTPVPWHQDDAYRPPEEQQRSLNVWIPLDEASPESGCLHFVPGSHRGGLRTHRSYPYDPTGLTLEAAPQPDETVTACPLPVGAASAHHCRTLHYSTANRSERRRRALVIVCEVTRSPVD